MKVTSESELGAEHMGTPGPWWRPDRRRVVEAAWPPGLTDIDLWRIDARSTTRFDPDRHERHRSLAEGPDLFAPIDAPAQSAAPSTPARAHQQNGPLER